jgi:hypothetical protein
MVKTLMHHLNLNSEIELGARPPRALFYAPSRKTSATGNIAETWNSSRAEYAGREGASSHARGGRAPRSSEFRLNTKLTFRTTTVNLRSELTTTPRQPRGEL